MIEADKRRPLQETRQALREMMVDEQGFPGWDPVQFAAWLRTRPDIDAMPRALQEAEYWEACASSKAEWAAAERQQRPALHAFPAWGLVRDWIEWARSRLTH
jgi:hypothetical protein